MELQAKLTALEEEVGILKVEIKSILQEVRVAVLARQNPFLADDLDRAVPPAPVTSVASPADTVASPNPVPATADEVLAAVAPGTPARIVRLAPSGPSEMDEKEEGPVAAQARRPVDLAALMVWLQETAEAFSPTELTMLITIACYGGLLDEGLKQALIDLSHQVARERPAQASMSEFSLALRKLEAIRPPTTGQLRRAA
jgi:hypothetical protein